MYIHIPHTEKYTHHTPHTHRIKAYSTHTATHTDFKQYKSQYLKKSLEVSVKLT